NEEGLVDINQLENSLKENTVLVSIMYANNEIGTVQPIGKIGRIVKKFKGMKEYPYFHTDASQAPNYLDCVVDRLGVDLMTLDGSKIYGPKGVGCLYKKHNVDISSIIIGGGQEKGLRAGTENVAGIVGFAKALEIAGKLREKESARLKELQKYFFDNTDYEVNGSMEHRLPNNINICVKGLDAEFEVIKLDEKGVACSFMTACKNLEDDSDSYVITALGKKECAGSSLRFSMGRGTTKDEIKEVINILSKSV
ncbi:MAG: cysteine desulfurase, partial [Candidatus Paceibacteria bacterium]